MKKDHVYFCVRSLLEIRNVIFAVNPVDSAVVVLPRHNSFENTTGWALRHMFRSARRSRIMVFAPSSGFVRL